MGIKGVELEGISKIKTCIFLGVSLFVILFTGASGVNAENAAVTPEGIVINGPGNTLSSIAKDIGNSAIFSYDPAAKTAVSSASLFINGSAELTMDNETLKFNCTSDGEYWLKTNFTLAYA